MVEKGDVSQYRKYVMVTSGSNICNYNSCTWYWYQTYNRFRVISLQIPGGPKWRKLQVLLYGYVLSSCGEIKYLLLFGNKLKKEYASNTLKIKEDSVAIHISKTNTNSNVGTTSTTDSVSITVSMVVICGWKGRRYIEHTHRYFYSRFAKSANCGSSDWTMLDQKSVSLLPKYYD